MSGIASITQGRVQSAKSIVNYYVANEDISALKAVRPISASNVALAVNNDTLQKARVLGFAILAAVTGNNVNVLNFGPLIDPSFSTFTLNGTVYLSSTSYLTQTPPVAGEYYVICGKYIGDNTVFINIEEPIAL